MVFWVGQSQLFLKPKFQCEVVRLRGDTAPSEWHQREFVQHFLAMFTKHFPFRAELFLKGKSPSWGFFFGGVDYQGLFFLGREGGQGVAADFWNQIGKENRVGFYFSPTPGISR